MKYKITNAWLSNDPDNPTICLNMDSYAKVILEKEGLDLTLLGTAVGAGCEGEVNSQLPIWQEDSQVYIGDTLINDTALSEQGINIVNELLDKATKWIDWREAEWIKKFGTYMIKEHQTGLQHGYYNSSSLALLENQETGEAYLTLQYFSAQDPEFYANEWVTFSNLGEAKSFIQSNILPGEFLQDFNITHRIWEKTQKHSSKGGRNV